MSLSVAMVLATAIVLSFVVGGAGLILWSAARDAAKREEQE